MKDTSKFIKTEIGNLKLKIIFINMLLGSDDNNIDKTNLHYHTQHEAFFVFNAPLVLKTESEVMLYKNCAICVKPFFYHYVENLSDSISMFVEYSKSNSATTSEDYYSKFESLISQHLVPLKLNDKIVSYLKDLSSCSHSEIKLECLLKLIFISFIEENASAILPKTETQVEYHYLIDNIIHHEYRENVNLSYISKKIHLGEKQISRIVKKRYNTSLSDLITKKRLNVAKVLLSETDKTVSTIAYEVGFSSENYFFVLFKKEFGVTPLKYRKLKLN